MIMVGIKSAGAPGNFLGTGFFQRGGVFHEDQVKFHESRPTRPGIEVPILRRYQAFRFDR